MGSGTARERARRELTEEIRQAARSELIETGAAGLSLRSVARRVGMTPSAIYRYFDGRDALLTELLLETFNELAEVVAEADRRSGADPLKRWRAVARAIRGWALDNPHFWALIHGSPVPGYQAPSVTATAAAGVTEVITSIVADGLKGEAELLVPTLSRNHTRWIKLIGGPLLAPLTPGQAAAAIHAYTWLLGAISAELFGEFGPGGAPASEQFDFGLTVTANLLGLSG